MKQEIANKVQQQNTLNPSRLYLFVDTCRGVFRTLSIFYDEAFI